MKKRKNKILLLLVLLLAITIGFAALATTLKINGTANISKSSWNIYWDNVANQKGVTPDDDPEITADENNVPKSLLTWEVDLNTPGEYYEFEVDAVNAGSLDAEIIGITSKYDNTPVISTENGVIVEDNSVIPSYIKYSIKYKDDGEKPDLGDSLPKAPNSTATPPVYTRKTYVIHVEYDKDAVTPAIVNNMNENGETHTFTFEVTYGQATTPAVPEPESFSTDKWPTIAKCANDENCPYQPGDIKNIEIDIDGDGTKETYRLRIANTSTPAACSTVGFSQTACGLVIEFADVTTTHRMNPYTDGSVDGDGNKGGWNSSEMRAYINSGKYLEGTANEIDYSTTGIYDKLPKELRDVIKDTTVVSGYGKNDASHGNFTTTDKLYLFSTKEVWGKEGTDTRVRYDKAEDETRQLDYYHNKGVTTDDTSYAVKKYTTYSGYEGFWWWLRSSYSNNKFRFYSVNVDGTFYDLNSTSDGGVSPAFRIG